MTGGKIYLDEKEQQWVVECEPHISLRLKRWFGKLGKQSKRYYRLADTIENARDLEMFASRFGLELNGVTDYLSKRAATHKKQQENIVRIIAGDAKVGAFDLAIPARDYQKVGAQLVLATRGSIIGDDLGLGKTCVAICLFASGAGTLPALVVTMTHLTTQWKNEIAKFAPQLKTHIINSTKVYDYNRPANMRIGQHRLAIDDGPVDVLIINYHKMFAWADYFAKAGIKLVVLDECQEARRRDSQKYDALKTVCDGAEFRCGLSATPIYNYGGELHNVFEVINPGALGTRSEFAQEWCGRSELDDKSEIEKPEAFGSYLRSSGLMIRRTRKEVGRELPGITIVPHHVGADLAKLSEVSSSCEELARMVLAGGSQENNLAGAELSTKLRQATGIAKAPFVAEFVTMLLESEKNVVLAGWHREVYNIWIEKLEQFNPVLYTGTETPNVKEHSKRLFLDGTSRVMIISLRSGAGLDGLQDVCRTTVHGELDYSPAVHNQLNGRVWRDGQKEPTFAYYLIADAGSDPVVVDILGIKKEQADGVVDLNAPVPGMRTDKDHIKKLATEFLKQKGKV